MWKTRNAACFNKIVSSDPIIVIVQYAHWLSVWADLQIQGRQGFQRRGALLRVAADIEK